jgi:hypothetical protein
VSQNALVTGANATIRAQAHGRDIARMARSCNVSIKFAQPLCDTL